MDIFLPKDIIYLICSKMKKCDVNNLKLTNKTISRKVSYFCSKNYYFRMSKIISKHLFNNFVFNFITIKNTLAKLTQVKKLIMDLNYYNHHGYYSNKIISNIDDSIATQKINYIKINQYLII